MKKRWTADQIARMLREADRELAKGLTVPDVCRKLGIAQATYYRWRQRHDPARAPDDRRHRQLELEIERLKRLVAELMLEKQMLQDLAKKKALPGFVWVLISGPTSTTRWPTLRKSGVFAASVGIEVQPSAMKEDGRLQVVPIAEAIGVFLIV
jgi:putative transposase